MERTIALKRGRINLNTGEFPLVLATNGEASDGHILNVAGIEIAERLPMFVNHVADPVMRMGGLIKPRVSGKTSQLGKASLHMTGVIDMQGDSALADIRRDVAQGISVGDITNMSIRWDDIGAPVARAALPKNHFAFSEAGAQGFSPPMFFERSRGIEGSIVGVGADQAALVGRAADTGRPDHVREFYELLVRGVNPWEKPDQLTIEADVPPFAEPIDREEMLEAVCAVCTARDIERAEVPATEPEPVAEVPKAREIDSGSVLLLEGMDRLPENTLAMFESIRATADEQIKKDAKAILYRMTGRIY